MKLRERVGKLEQRTVASIGDEGGCWPILLVELTDDGPDEETAIALACEREGRPVNSVTGGGGPIRMVIVDMRTDHDQMEVQGNET